MAGDLDGAAARSFSAAIDENIATGRRGFDEVVARPDGRRARVHQRVARDTDGRGEGGARVRGEKLRPIARAILRDAPILILDEPTASLDAQTEAVVLRAIGELTANRTCLIIAQRLSTILSADRIVVLRDGRIEEHGTFAELMERGGHFAALYRVQLAGEGMPHGAP